MQKDVEQEATINQDTLATKDEATVNEDIIDGQSLSESNAEIDSVENDLTIAQSKVAELNDAWLRARADLENMQRRHKDELANTHRYAISKIATDLLSVKDSLEMALNDETGQVESLKSGVELTLKQLTNVLERSHIVEINPVGEKLDPHQHQAVSVQPADAEPNTILMVMQKGYQLYNRVLRPAMVVVSSGRSTG